MKKIKFKKFEKYKYKLDEILSSENIFDEVKRGLNDGICYSLKSQINTKILKDFKNKLPTDNEKIKYIPRKQNCSNYMQIHRNHPGQVVRAEFISWSYFPWNEESKEIFKLLAPLYTLRNKMADIDEEKYIIKYDETACARIAVQFYPSGVGFMAEHQDPLNPQQYAIPTIMLSEIGKEFINGGFYLVNEEDKKIYLDAETNFGDILLFHTSIPHGVEIIDKHLTQDSIINLNRGRMMLIAAVNAFSGADGNFSANETNYGKI